MRVLMLVGFKKRLMLVGDKGDNEEKELLLGWLLLLLGSFVLLLECLGDGGSVSWVGGWFGMWERGSGWRCGGMSTVTKLGGEQFHSILSNNGNHNDD